MSQPANEATKIRSAFLWRWARYSTVIAGLALGLVPATCQAETAITAQAIADNGAFLPYAPPPPQLTGLCLVDTGVNLNPDTVLAMMAAAPANGWGMVGTAPHSTQIVSVRILEPGQTTFPFSSYAAGITECLQLRQRYDIGVINLSLGNSDTPTNRDYETIANAVKEASNYGISVVAAAGNDDGGPVEYPAAYPGVLSVGASDTQGGAFCSFSNRGEGLRMIAPGCALNGADPSSGEPDYNYWQGTSEASVIDAAALDALRSYEPGLSPQAAEEDLTGADNGVLDIAQTFRNAGLGQIVTEGEAAEPSTQPPPRSSPTTPPQSVPPSGPMVLLVPFSRPSARFERIKGRLVLVLEHRPSEAQAEVRYLAYRDHSRHLSVLRTRSGVFDTLTMPSLNVLEILVRYTDPYDLERASPWTTLKLPHKTTRIAKSDHHQ
jgi:predicted secreted protein